MTELQFWHWVATSALGLLVAILAFYGKRISDKADDAMTRQEFKDYVERIEVGRREFRESQIKMFERMDNHDKLDASRFEILTKDFNGGLQRLSEKMSDNQVQLLTELSKKADRN